MFKKIRRIRSIAATALVLMFAIGLQVAPKPTTALLMDYVHWRANQITHEMTAAFEQALPHLQVGRGGALGHAAITGP